MLIIGIKPFMTFLALPIVPPGLPFHFSLSWACRNILLMDSSLKNVFCGISEHSAGDYLSWRQVQQGVRSCVSLPVHGMSVKPGTRCPHVTWAHIMWGGTHACHHLTLSHVSCIHTVSRVLSQETVVECCSSTSSSDYVHVQVSI